MTELSALIVLLLKSVGLWEKLSKYFNAVRRLERDKESQNRSAAIDLAKDAHTPEEAYKAQEDITRNLP